MHLPMPKSEQNDSMKGEIEGSLYIALEGAFGCIWLHLLGYSLMQKRAQNNSSNGEFDGSLKGALDGELDIV